MAPESRLFLTQHHASGELIGAVNMLVDITDRIRAEQRARRPSSVVEFSDDAIVTKDLALRNDAATVLANTPFLLTRCSSDLRYLFVSDACAKMISRGPEEVVGKKKIPSRRSTRLSADISFEARL